MTILRWRRSSAHHARIASDDATAPCATSIGRARRLPCGRSRGCLGRHVWRCELKSGDGRPCDDYRAAGCRGVGSSSDALRNGSERATRRARRDQGERVWAVVLQSSVHDALAERRKMDGRVLPGDHERCSSSLAEQGEQARDRRAASHASICSESIQSNTLRCECRSSGPVLATVCRDRALRPASERVEAVQTGRPHRTERSRVHRVDIGRVHGSHTSGNDAPRGAAGVPGRAVLPGEHEPDCSYLSASSARPCPVKAPSAHSALRHDDGPPNVVVGPRKRMARDKREAISAGSAWRPPFPLPRGGLGPTRHLRRAGVPLSALSAPGEGGNSRATALHWGMASTFRKPIPGL